MSRLRESEHEKEQALMESVNETCDLQRKIKSMEQQQQRETDDMEEEKRQLEKEVELMKQQCESLERESKEAAHLREEMKKLETSYAQLHDQVNVEHEIGEHAEEVCEFVPP